MENQQITLLSDCFKSWLENRKPSVKESTFALYTLIVRKHLMPYFGNLTLEDLSLDSLLGFIDILLEDELAPKTIKDIFVLLQTIITAAEESTKKLFSEAQHSLPVISEKVIDILNQEEIEKLLNYLISHLSAKNLGILLGLRCGLRIGEVCGVKWRNINTEKRLITVNSTVYRLYDTSLDSDKGKTRINKGSPKTKRSNRLVPFSKEMLMLIGVVKANNNAKDEDYLLSLSEKVIEPRTFSSYYEGVLEKAGIGKHTFHCLRHTFATRAALEGMNPEDLSRILGHSSVNITLTRYYHPTPEDLVRALDKVNI